MEIQGKVITVLDVQRGTSARTGKDWAQKTFVIETQEQYPRKVAIEIFGEDRINDYPVEVDMVVSVDADVESREFNGRYYTSVRMYRMKRIDDNQPTDAPEADSVENASPAPAQSPAQSTAVTDAPSENSAQSGSDDLPF